MKKIGWALGIVLVFAGFAGWWYHANTPAKSAARALRPNEKLQVVASGYVVYTLTRAMAGDLIELSLLVPPGTEPHHFEPTPGSIIAVDRADVFFYLSKEIEPWVADIQKGLSGANIVETASVEPGEEPHVWMTPYGALSMAKQISKALSEADPEHQPTYRANFKKFSKEIQQLHQDFEQGLKTCKSRRLIHLGHLAFGSLAATYDLELHSLSNTAHQAEHSVRSLSELVRLIKKEGVPAIFTEEMLSSRLPDTLAKETGVSVYPLYTIEEVSKRDFEQQISYVDYMQRNLHQLQEGLQCRK